MTAGRVASLILLPAGLFCAVFAAVLFVWLPFVFAPDPHVWLHPTLGDYLVVFGPPVFGGLAAMAPAIWWLERRTYGPPSARVVSARQLWATRLAPLLLVVVLVAGGRAVYFFNTVSAAQRGEFGAAQRLANLTGGLGPLAAIARDAALPMPTRLAAATELAIAQSAGHDVDLVFVEAGASRDPGVRLEATRLAQHLSPDRARPVLRALIDDGDATVRLQALRWIDGASPAEDPALLDRLEQLVGSDDPAVRRAAFGAYTGAFPAAPARTERLDATLRRLLADRHADVRVWAAGSLAARKDPAGYDVAMAALKDGPAGPPSDERGPFESAMYVLGTIQDERAAPMLWTVAHCPAIALRYRESAATSLRLLYIRQGVGSTNKVPDVYKAVDVREAPLQPAWRAAFCH